MNPPLTTTKPKVLVAPLDWGLGHATRCIPIIHQLLAAGCEVFLAGEGKTEVLLREEFPDLQFLTLAGYDMHYGKSKFSLLRNMIAQVPKMLLAIQEEFHWLQKAVAEHGIDLVISDNRYGLYHAKARSVFITHQLLIKTPFGEFGDKTLQRMNYSFINSFDECWVPDTEDEKNLAGELSHPELLPDIPMHYIGSLSRFDFSTETKGEKHLLIMLSGPEPQRSILEVNLLQQLKEYPKAVLFVRGLPGSMELPETAMNIRIINHLPKKELETAIREAHMIIARCGYSTIMDLMQLQRKSVLIPTPGQTEQEYLASHLTAQKMALCIPQDQFRLQTALEQAAAFDYAIMPMHSRFLVKEAIDNLLLHVPK
jgi:uncharacterized protein (TIGR00661 family)